MIPAMAIGAGANIVGGIMAGNAAEKAANQAAAINEQNYQRNKALLESIGIPSIEAQEIALNNPEYVGDLVAELQGDTALKEIATNPQMRQKQMDVLAQLQGLSETGLGTTDRIALDEAEEKATQDDKSRRASILSEMAQRGTLDSGASLASQLQSNQQANQNQLEASRNIAKQAQAGRMNAMNSLAQQAGNLESLDYNRAADTATAQDAIQRFNASTRNQANQYNTTSKQNLANQASSNANQQQMYNKGLIQQDYNNRLGRAQSSIGMNNSNAQNQAQNALTAGAGKANMYSQIGSGIGNAATSYGDYSADQEALDKKLELAKLSNSKNNTSYSWDV